MLWTAVPAAHAADEAGGRRFQALLGGLQDSIAAGLAPRRLAFMQGDSAPPAADDLLFRPQGSVRTLMSFHFEDELSVMRKGVGFDLALPDVGYLYLNLYARDPGARGKRWKLHDEARAPQAQQLWTIGGTVDLVRDGPNASRQVNVNPQLQLDLDGIFGMDSQCEGSVQYANWKGNIEDNRSLGRVVQLMVKWRF